MPSLLRQDDFFRFNDKVRSGEAPAPRRPLRAGVSPVAAIGASPEELQAKLDNPSGTGALNSSKGAAVEYTGIGVIEAHLVKDVEEL